MEDIEILSGDPLLLAFRRKTSGDDSPEGLTFSRSDSENTDSGAKLLGSIAGESSFRVGFRALNLTELLPRPEVVLRSIVFH